MRNLLYKELRLATHPTTYIFMLFGAMLLIPSYPYYVAFMYMCLGVFFVFLNGRENNDLFFTVSLPVAKADAVKARCIMVAIMEIGQILISIPFALLSYRLIHMENVVRMEINPAFYGFVFLMFGIFNLLFLPIFYKTGYQVGKALLIGGSAVLLYILVVEAATYFVPFMMALDTRAPERMCGQIPVLAGGIVAFSLCTALACYISQKRFEKVDL